MTKNKYQVPALLKSAGILEMLSRKNADFTEILHELALPRSSTYSLLLTLEEIGFVRRLPDGHRFTLGFKLFELGNLAVSNVSIRDHAMTFLKELSYKEKVTCHLGVLDGNEAMYLLKVDPQDSILINSWEGKRLSLTSSAMGKIILAFLPPKKRIALLDQVTYAKKTPKTIVDCEVFRKHLEKVAVQGWAIDDEEDILGIRCIAAPVFSPNEEIRYSLSVTSTTQRITDERIPALVKTIKDTAQNISKSLGTGLSTGE